MGAGFVAVSEDGGPQRRFVLSRDICDALLDMTALTEEENANFRAQSPSRGKKAHEQMLMRFL